MEACFCQGIVSFLPQSGGGIGCPSGYDDDAETKNGGILYIFWNQASNGNGYGRVFHGKLNYIYGEE